MSQDHDPTPLELAQMPVMGRSHFGETLRKERMAPTRFNSETWQGARWWLSPTNTVAHYDGFEFEVDVELLGDDGWFTAYSYSRILDPEEAEAQVLGDSLLEGPDLVSFDGDVATFRRNLTPNEASVLMHRGIGVEESAASTIEIIETSASGPVVDYTEGDDIEEIQRVIDAWRPGWTADFSNQIQIHGGFRAPLVQDEVQWRGAETNPRRSDVAIKRRLMR